MKIITDEAKIKQVLSRRMDKNHVFPSMEEVVKKFQEGKQLRVYLGIDPTGPEIHLGHTVPLLFLKDFYELGHKPIILIGTFTAKIGDPSGKESARKAMTDEEIAENMKDYLRQVHKILPEGSFELRYNGDWLSKLSFADVIRLASKFTVQQMIVRDMFQERIKRERPIYLNEFLYPLAQGYDSVAMEVDGEVGGSDQIFNMLVGRDLEKEVLGKDKIVLATRLLENSEGKKMSKSEGGLIAVDDQPNDMYGKVMAGIPDDMIKIVFELCTNKDLDWIESKQKEMESGDNPKNFKEELALELVRMYHSDDDAKKAKEEFQRVFSENKLPENMPELKVEGEREIIEAILSAGLIESKSEVKRLLDQGAVSINGEIEKKWDKKIKPGDVIKIGPRKFLKII